MAKANPFKKDEGSKYPSQYGSHSSMIDAEMTAKLTDKAFVVLKDELGHYVTERKRLDSGMADPHRYAEDRSTLLKEKVNEPASV